MKEVQLGQVPLIENETTECTGGRALSEIVKMNVLELRSNSPLLAELSSPGFLDYSTTTLLFRAYEYCC